jgi:hypothetical protein
MPRPSRLALVRSGLLRKDATPGESNTCRDGLRAGGRTLFRAFTAVSYSRFVTHLLGYLPQTCLRFPADVLQPVRGETRIILRRRLATKRLAGTTASYRSGHEMRSSLRNPHAEDNGSWSVP